MRANPASKKNSETGDIFGKSELIELNSIEFIGYRIPQYEQNGPHSLIHKASINKSVAGIFDILIGLSRYSHLKLE